MLRRAGSANFECCIGEGISRPEGAGVGRAIGLGAWSEDEHVLTGDFLGESAIIAQLCRSEDQVGERSRRLVTRGRRGSKGRKKGRPYEQDRPQVYTRETTQARRGVILVWTPVETVILVWTPVETTKKKKKTTQARRGVILVWTPVETVIFTKKKKKTTQARRGVILVWTPVETVSRGPKGQQFRGGVSNDSHRDNLLPKRTLMESLGLAERQGHQSNTSTRGRKGVAVFVTTERGGEMVQLRRGDLLPTRTL